MDDQEEFSDFFYREGAADGAVLSLVQQVANSWRPASPEGSVVRVDSDVASEYDASDPTRLQPSLVRLGRTVTGNPVYNIREGRSPREQARSVIRGLAEEMTHLVRSDTERRRRNTEATISGRIGADRIGRDAGAGTRHQVSAAIYPGLRGSRVMPSGLMSKNAHRDLMGQDGQARREIGDVEYVRRRTRAMDNCLSELPAREHDDFLAAVYPRTSQQTIGALMARWGDMHRVGRNRITARLTRLGED